MPPGPTSPIAPAPGRRLRGLAAAAAATVLVLAAMPATGARADGGTEENTLTIAVSQQVDSFSPFLAQLLLTTSIHRLTYDYLTNYDPETNEPIEGLAQSWEHSDDGRTWTFDIREGEQWSDGEPLTAEDVAWTYTTMMTNEAAATANGNFVGNFAEVTAPDATTVEITLDEPQSTMLALDIPIVPEHVWSDVDDFARFNNDEFPVVGSGPFVLTDHEPNRSITLEANPDHWRGPPNFDRLVFRYYDDQDASVEALRKGEVSFVEGLTPAQADALDDEANITVNNAAGKRFEGFTINPGAETQDGREFGDGHPALQDKTLRQAIMAAIDKDEIVETVYGGYAEAAEGYIPARYEDYTWEPEGDDRIDFAPDAAEAMLDEAGYEMGEDGVRESPGGDPLELRMHVHNDDPARVAIGKLMAEWLGDIGIEIDNRTVDPGVLSDALYAGEYDLIFTGWTVNPDPDIVLGIHTCDALPTEPGTMRGDAYFCNEGYDELYDKQLAEFDDPDQRASHIRDMQAILYEEAVVNVLTYPNAVEAYRSDQIADIQVQPDPGGNIWAQDGYWSWWSAEPAADQSGAGPPGWAITAVSGAVVLMIAGTGALVWRRRATTAEDRE